jgi:hypothetical protein
MFREIGYKEFGTLCPSVTTCTSFNQRLSPHKTIDPTASATTTTLFTTMPRINDILIISDPFSHGLSPAMVERATRMVTLIIRLRSLQINQKFLSLLFKARHRLQAKQLPPALAA